MKVYKKHVIHNRNFYSSATILSLLWRENFRKMTHALTLTFNVNSNITITINAITTTAAAAVFDVDVADDDNYKSQTLLLFELSMKNIIFLLLCPPIHKYTSSQTVA